jgi:hypothetical protein
MREGRRLLSDPLVRLPCQASPYMPKLKRQRARLNQESVAAARGASSRSIRSSRRRASRARRSSSTRGTLWLHRVSFSMAPSIARSFPIAIRAEPHQYRTRLRTRVIYPTLPGFILRGRGLRRRHSVFVRDHPAALCSAMRRQPQGTCRSSMRRAGRPHYGRSANRRASLDQGSRGSRSRVLRQRCRSHRASNGVRCRCPYP